MVRRTAAFLLAASTLAGCDDGTGPEETGQVEVRFETTAEAAASPSAAPRAIPVMGSNGTLEIESVHVIVGEFELEREEDDCPGDNGPAAGDDCQEFEAAPFLLELPLGDGGAVTVAATDVAPGSYTAFDFEVEDLEADEDDDDEAELAQALFDARALHPDWPDGASMVVEGTFIPSGEEDARSFRVFVEAELEVESTLPTPLVVEAGGEAAVTVVLAPEAWFTRPNGTVVDLSLFDFTGPGDLLELEVELEDGVVEVEVESG